VEKVQSSFLVVRLKNNVREILLIADSFCKQSIETSSKQGLLTSLAWLSGRGFKNRMFAIPNAFIFISSLQRQAAVALRLAFLTVVVLFALPFDQS